MPVRSEATQPLLPSVLPTRLWPCEVKVPETSAPVPAVLPATIVLPSVAVPVLTRPPPVLAELALTVQLMSVTVPALVRPPPLLLAELPLMVQLVSVSVPKSCSPPPLPALPPVIVSPVKAALTPASTWNTRLRPPPLTVTPPAGPVIVSSPLGSLSSSWWPLRVIVCGVAKTVGSKVMVLATPSVLARMMARGRLRRPEPAKKAPLGVFTTRLAKLRPVLVSANDVAPCLADAATV